MGRTLPLSLSNARYLRHQRYPHLIVEVEGRTTCFLFEPQKPYGLNNGLVYLGESFADVVPDLVDGFTSDRRLFALFERYARACSEGTFKPGPVAIPD
jgi:hypothetical protein